MDKKTDNSRAGFTLVELVVVIAILGILAGVGYVAYNGYISYAHKGVDMQLIGEIEDAMAVEAQSNIAASGLADSEGSPTVVGNIFLYCPKAAEDGNPAVDGTPQIQELEGQNLINTALESTFGSGFESQLALTYDGWGEVDGTAGAFQNLGPMGAMGVVENYAGLFGRAMHGWNATKTLLSVLEPLGARDILHQAGYTDDIIDNYLTSESTNYNKDHWDDRRELINGNLLILTLTKYTKEHSDEISKCFKTNTADGEEISYKDAAFFEPITLTFDANGNDPISKLAGNFLALGAFVNYLGNDDIINAYNSLFADLPFESFTLNKPTIKSRIKETPQTILNLIENSNDPELKEKANEYFKSQADTDAKGLVSLAGDLNNVQGQLLSEGVMESKLSKNKKFLDLFSKITGSNVMITVYSDGTCDVSPIEADPKAE